jgi:hypothetical protein
MASLMKSNSSIIFLVARKMRAFFLPAGRDYKNPHVFIGRLYNELPG